MEDAATAEELQTLGGATEVPAVEQPEAPSVPRNKPLGVRIRENSWFGKKCVKIFKIFKCLGTPSEDIWQGSKDLPEMKITFPKWKVNGNENLINLCTNF